MKNLVSWKTLTSPSGRTLAGLNSFIVKEWPFLLLFCFFFVSLIYWVCLDRTVPTWDSADHLLRSYGLKRVLINQPAFGRRIHELLTVADRYPPLFNWVHCAFLFSPLPTLVADQLPRFVFFAIGIVSLYKLGHQLFNDGAVALTACAIFFALPLVCVLSHSRGLIDLPLVSMCFLALWLIVRWNAAPSLANSLMAGVAIGLACLTKQMGVIYLAPAICLVLLRRLLARDFAKAIQFSIGLGLATIMYLIWLVPSLPLIKKSMYLWDQELGSQAGVTTNWFSSLALRITVLVESISVPVSVLFVISLFNFPAQRKLWIPATTIGGLFFLCTLSWCFKDARYVLPLVGYVALSIAALLVRMWRSGSPLLRAVDVAFGIYLIAVYFVFNFAPYPLPLGEVRSCLDNPFNGFYSSWPGVYPSNPNTLNVHAYEWLLDHIQAERSKHIPTILLTGNSRWCEPGSLLYLASQRGMQLRPESMIVTDLGKFFRCKPSEVDQDADWYVTMKNDPESEFTHFASERDRENYSELEKYFEGSGRYSKAGEFKVPGNETRIVLYRKRDSKDRPQRNIERNIDRLEDSASIGH